MKDLAPDEKKLIDNIAEYGWHVIQVPGEGNEPDFCYSVGIYKTFGAPEVVIIGLPLDVGHELINLIGDDLSTEMSYKPGQYYADIIEGYECYMTAVDQSHYKDYFGYGIWYYKNEDFPVTQCIYPDEDNVYPWDWSEEERMQQPVLGPH